MNLFRHIRGQILTALDDLERAGRLPAGLPLHAIQVEPPRDPSHGDMATNAAMVLAKPAGMNPRALADLLVETLKGHADIQSIAIAGPGFINMTLRPDRWQGLVPQILDQGLDYGRSDLGARKKVNVEYVSANPTGPLHVGHCRGAVVGDALANLLSFAGYDVAREYYINDAGAQVDTLARSAFLRYREALGETIGDIPEGLYPGEYLKSVGQGLAEKYGRRLIDQPESEWLAPVRQFAIDAMMDMIREDLSVIGIRHDVFSSERALVDAGGVDRAIAYLESKGQIYTGVLEPPKGKTPEDYEPRPQLLFRATNFGDEVDRPLKKSDGSWTYFAGDVAYHYDKFQRGFAEMIDVWGADHGGYVKRMKAAVKAMTDGAGDLDIKLCQLVNLMDGGQPVKMSKRAGNFVTLRDVVDEVGRDVVRFIMLTRKNDMALDFDYQKVREQSKDNPVFYVQYAHARAASVMRNAREAGHSIDKAALRSAQTTRLVHPAELGLLRTLGEWPRMVEGAALAHEPHRVAFYLQDLAAAFHSFWNAGKDDPSLRFIQEDDADLTRARLALLASVKTVIAAGLAVMGVEPVEEMR